MRIGRRGGGLIGLLVLLVVVVVNDMSGRDGELDRSPGAELPVEAGGSLRAQVRRIVDGDTIEVEIGGRTEDVRYIGIDTPESVKPGTPVECFAKEASAANESLVGGERVLLEFDRELRDRFGRLLAYVFVNETLVNAELVREGYATTLEIAPNTSRAEQFSALEQRAGARGLGLWSRC